MNIDDLRKIAENATQGEWELVDHNEGMFPPRPLWGVANDEFFNPTGGDDDDWLAVEIHTGDKADAEFIATFNPEMVLALLDRVEKAEQELGKYEKRLERTENEYNHLETSHSIQEQALQRVRDRHQPCLSCLEPHCFVCEKAKWPCAEFRALEGDDE